MSKIEVNVGDVFHWPLDGKDLMVTRVGGTYDRSMIFFNDRTWCRLKDLKEKNRVFKAPSPEPGPELRTLEEIFSDVLKILKEVEALRKVKS